MIINQKIFVNPYNILVILKLITINLHNVRNPLDCLSDCDIGTLLQGAISPEYKTNPRGKSLHIGAIQKVIEVMECIIGLSEKPKDLLTDQQTQILNLLRERLQQIYRQEWNRSIAANTSLKFFEPRASKLDFLKNPTYALEVLKSMKQHCAEIDFFNDPWVQDLNLFKTIIESKNEDYKKAVSRMIPELESRIQPLQKTSDSKVKCPRAYLAEWKKEFPPLEGPQTEKESHTKLVGELIRLKGKTKVPHGKPRSPTIRTSILELICNQDNEANPLLTLEILPQDELTDLLQGLVGEKRREQLQKIKDKVDCLVLKKKDPLKWYQEIYNQIVAEIETLSSAEKEIHHSDQTNSSSALPSIPPLGSDQHQFASSSSQPQNVTPLPSQTRDDRQSSRKRVREDSD
jgi:hypothetical protein